MSDATDGTGSTPPTAEEVRQLLDRILCSRQFSNSPKKQKFLQLICEAYLDGRASDLSEYSIGYEVFDRNETYDPALDSIVRVGAHELRKKLELYYKSEGKNDEILLEIPVGSYIPIFTRLRQAPEATESTKAALSTPLLSGHIGLAHWKDLDRIVEPGVSLFDNCSGYVGSIQPAVTDGKSKKALSQRKLRPYTSRSGSRS